MAFVSQIVRLDMKPQKNPPHVDCTQYDSGEDGLLIHFVLFNDGSEFSVPSGYTAKLEGTTKENTGFIIDPYSIDVHGVSFSLTEDATAFKGSAWCKIVFEKDSSKIATSGFWLDNDRAGVEADTVIGAPGFEEQIQDAVNEYLEDFAIDDDVVIDAVNDYLSNNGVPVDSALSTTSVNPVQNKAVKVALDGKQNTLTAGQNVTITGNTISAEVDSAEIASNVTDWLDDNVTPVGSAVVVDSSLSIAGAAADAKATGDNIGELKTAMTEIVDVVLLNGFAPLTASGYYGVSGEVIANDSFGRSEAYTTVKPSTEYSVWWARYNNSFDNVVASSGVCFYDADKNFISRTVNSHTFTTPSTCKYIRTYLAKTVYNNYEYTMITEGTTEPLCHVPYGYDVITAYEKKLGKNYNDSFASDLSLLDSINIVNGNREYTLSDVTLSETSGRYMNAINVFKPATNWSTWSCNIEPNSIYQYYASRSSGAYAVSVFDAQGRRIQVAPSTLSSGTEIGYIKTAANASTIVINAFGITPTLKKVTAITLASPESYTDTVLYGKKLYCGGDSITEAVNVGSFPNGYKKSYAGYVATRNNMVYVSDGVGGSTMGVCNVDGQTLYNFVTSRYLSIPTDADFVTLWFGWNDNAYGWRSARDAYCVEQYGTYYEALTSEQKATVDAYKTWRQWMKVYAGTKDSTDNTTWGGAWNTVLNWLLNNCPNARIGIVIAYGVYDELNDVLIEICEKYGVSYIKAYDPHEFFSVGHSKGIGTDQATKRKALYTLDNTHPNELGYEMMSTYFEQFLRTI